MAHSVLGYRDDCPVCGAALTAVCLAPDTAPWLCHPCHRGFFTAELSDIARARYRPRFHDWGQGTPALAIRDQVQAEWNDAQERGSSLRADQLHHIDVDSLRLLVKRPGVHPDFVAAAALALAERDPQ